MSNYVNQVGGDHYACEYQHWDWAPETGLGYLEASATAYIARHKKKNGKQDLEKALSFINKIIAMKYLPPAGKRPEQSATLRHRFLIAAGLYGTVEGTLITWIDLWGDDSDLAGIVKNLEAMINDYGG